MKLTKKFSILAWLELVFVITWIVVSALAVGSNKYFFIPEFFAPQLGFAVVLLAVPISGLRASRQKSADAAFWHAFLSCSGTCVTATSCVLAAYGLAIGVQMEKFYSAQNNPVTFFDTWDSYCSWILAAPALCFVCSVIMTILPKG
ncbi:Oidioi.mRNA.OKI2018_I69.chr2.g7586.t1.cds [Oikopleura dioica]|uniref:Oidioi.mRNA.OKI2018_I69.chr2.g7586.t1.cds n=1 Tax=Oikopleura dioica TaxID=34765 RepID=A0ABN7TDF9_OIKDI|nr:Oidioi.mRNA.OKI2018_I69.chr2.g7586.t1.cds [Oikopleura dioica]